MVDPLLILRHGKPIDLAGLWAPNPAFLICGGPSLNDFPLQRLRDRGVVSLAINQAAAWAPAKAWVFSDDHIKFLPDLYLDPAMMTFAPQPKLHRRFHMRDAAGFHATNVLLDDCPNTFGFHRQTCFIPETFYTTDYAHWGPRKDQPVDRPMDGCLCTMMIGLRLLNYLGCKRIYLLGVDYKGRDGMCYGFPDDKRERNRRYRWEGHMLRLLKPEQERRGIEIYNCNPNTSCDLYPFRSFDDAMRDCKGSVGDDPLSTFGWYDKKRHERECAVNPPLVPVHYGKAA